MIGGQHRSNMELIAQGVANMASPHIYPTLDAALEGAHEELELRRRLVTTEKRQAIAS
jgi:hypothetical protein